MVAFSLIGVEELLAPTPTWVEIGCAAKVEAIGSIVVLVALSKGRWAAVAPTAIWVELPPFG